MTVIAYLLIEGVIGTTCLVVLSLCGGGIYDLTLTSFGILVVASLCAFSSLILIQFSIATGVSGVALSIYNSFAAIQTTFSFFALGQQISKAQACGVVCTLLGTCVLSLSGLI